MKRRPLYIACPLRDRHADGQGCVLMVPDGTYTADEIRAMAERAHEAERHA